VTKYYEVADSTFGQEERAAILRACDEGRFTMGDYVRRFEEAFAITFGVRHAVMVNSGSSANLVAVAALTHLSRHPLRRGDEVLVPALSWATTYHPLQQYGLKLRFVDIELDTLNIDAARLESAITPGTRMIVGVNVLGNPAALDVIREVCDRRGLYFLEDNCESLGARLHDRAAGTFGDVSTFSTFFSHQLSTIEGGVLVTASDEIAALARTIRNHGWDRASDVGTAGPGSSFPEAYRFTVPGYNVRPLDLCAAVGLEQLKKLPTMLDMRRRNAAVFRTLFTGDERFITQRERGCSSWFSFTLVLNPRLDLDRERAFAALRAAGIDFRMITGGCFLRHEASRFFDYDTAGDIVNANIAHDRGFFVGNHAVDLGTRLERLHAVLDAALR
jgi:CDP-6-deoxy-D-xylo-4-hexulose-3-dehydrase